MSSDGKQVLQDWFEEVWHQGREESVYRLFAENGIAHGLAEGEAEQLVGPAAYVPFLRAYRGAFPDIRFEIEDAVQEGDKVAVRCRVRGTHKGDGLGIAPTQRAVDIAGMTFAVVRDGQIREAWNIFDFRSLMAQLEEPHA